MPAKTIQKPPAKTIQQPNRGNDLPGVNARARDVPERRQLAEEQFPAAATDEIQAVTDQFPMAAAGNNTAPSILNRAGRRGQERESREQQHIQVTATWRSSNRPAADAAVALEETASSAISHSRRRRPCGEDQAGGRPADEESEEQTSCPSGTK